MIRSMQLVACALLIVGCTTAPDKYRSAGSSSISQLMPATLAAQSSKMQAVATAEIGSPSRYVDPESGMTVELIVMSEYFSANGRNCRRFVEVSGAQERSGVGCQDAREGWVELPLATYLR